MLSEEILYRLNPWWENRTLKLGFLREKYLEQINIDSRRITLIQGSRRIGKSTLLLQIVDRLLKGGIEPTKIFYISLDHALLEDNSIFSILEDFRTRFSHPLSEKLYLLLDEVQDNENWISELKTLFDSDNVKFFCTGSHTALLDSEGSKLTGRYNSIILQPMNFSEYLEIKNISYSKSENYLYVNEVKNYLNSGGYPEMVLGEDVDYLKALLLDVIERDLRSRYKLKKHYLLEDLFRLIIKSAGSPISLQKMSNVLKTTSDTLKEYVYLFRKCFLVQGLPKWTWSENERIYNPNKLYPLDTAFFSIEATSSEWGKKAELAVFNSLMGQSKIGYYKIDGLEVDFAYGNLDSLTLLESKFTDNLTILDKRLQAIAKAIKHDSEGDIKKVIIITDKQEGQETFRGVNCDFIPLWKWLLGS